MITGKLNPTVDDLVKEYESINDGPVRPSAFSGGNRQTESDVRKDVAIENEDSVASEADDAELLEKYNNGS